MRELRGEVKAWEAEAKNRQGAANEFRAHAEELLDKSDIQRQEIEVLVARTTETEAWASGLAELVKSLRDGTETLQEAARSTQVRHGEENQRQEIEYKAAMSLSRDLALQVQKCRQAAGVGAYLSVIFLLMFLLSTL